LKKTIEIAFPSKPVVWVTGASRGIGREIALQFARYGCRLALSSRSKRNLNSLARTIVFEGGDARSYPCDISDERQIRRVTKEISKTLGNVDVLINNAGITVFKPFIGTSRSEFRSIIETNLLGQVFCTRAVLPSMIKNKSGWIINILSNAAAKIFQGSAAYTAAKTGMRGFGKVLREELRPFGVKVVNVLPGPVETTMWTAAARRSHAHRMMKASSVAEAVLALYQMPPDVVVDEIIIRPLQGDID
jgi:short-subunit dehydrogenase